MSKKKYNKKETGEKENKLTKKLDEKNSVKKEIAKNFSNEEIKKIEKEMKTRLGETPTKESVFQYYKNSGSPTFKDVKDYNDVMNILKHGNKEGDENIPEEEKEGQDKTAYEFIKKSIKEEKKEEEAKPKLEEVKKIEEPQKEIKPEEEKETKEAIKEIIKEEKTDQRFPQIKQQITTDNKKEITTDNSEDEKKEKESKSKKGFWKGTKNIITRPFKKSRQTTKWITKTAKNIAKFGFNSVGATIKTVGKTIWAPVGFTSYYFAKGTKGIKEWAGDYKKYRSFVKKSSK